MDLIKAFRENSNNEDAIKMKKYMKDNFEFIGVRSPIRKELQKVFFKSISGNKTLDRELVRWLWSQDEREYQYVAIDYLINQKRNLEREDILLIKELIVRKPWWDTIDLISSHLVGYLCKTYPDLVDEYIKEWYKDNNMWLRRTTLLYQLKYKNKLDTLVLEESIKYNINDEEFFIRKAIGWALREYSKVNKAWVEEFLSNNKELSTLSIREASKYL